MDPNIERIIQLEKEKSELEVESKYLYEALLNIRRIASVGGQVYYVANAASNAYADRRKK